MATLRRIRTLATVDEAELEGRRQTLLDQQWKRHRSMLVTGVVTLGLATGQLPFKQIAELFRAAWGGS